MAYVNVEVLYVLLWVRKSSLSVQICLGVMFLGVKEAGLWSVVLHSLIQKQDRAKRTVCSTNTKVEHWAGENVFLMPSLLTSVSKMWIKSQKDKGQNPCGKEWVCEHFSQRTVQCLQLPGGTEVSFVKMETTCHYRHRVLSELEKRRYRAVTQNSSTQPQDKY